MTQLRPINLCNTFYKVISKILVARLWPCMASLVSPNQAILNGELTDTFSPKCGIRQGDPFSPISLFCVWRSFAYYSAVCSGQGLEAVNHAIIMKKCLDGFCSLSSHKVSFEKSMIRVSPNISSELAHSTATICGSPLTTCLDKYLAKIHLVNWDTVCKPKFVGGLGIKNSAWMNQALLAKTG
ncbi:unnamed protein product [Prunus brigantina]